MIWQCNFLEVVESVSIEEIQSSTFFNAKKIFDLLKITAEKFFNTLWRVSGRYTCDKAVEQSVNIALLKCLV